MNCPVCGERLRAIERSGIEIDICPGCKGVWLDRGELEKLIQLDGQQGERAAASPREHVAPTTEAPRQDARRDEHRDAHRRYEHEDQRHEHRGYDSHGRDEHGHASGPHGKKRRGSWLADIFEGFGGDD